MVPNADYYVKQEIDIGESRSRMRGEKCGRSRKGAGGYNKQEMQCDKHERGNEKKRTGKIHRTKRQM